MTATGPDAFVRQDDNHPADTDTAVAVARHVLTTAELDAIRDAITTATSTRETLHRATTGVYRAILARTGRSLHDVPADQPLDPRAYAIPSAQWEAIAVAATARAAEWGTSTQLGLALVNQMRHYPDPTTTVPARPQPDRRPPVHTIRVTREAVDVIAACDAHLHQLAGFYGPESRIHLDALASWHTQLARLFSMSLGAHTTISRDGDLSLIVSTESGIVFGVIFHGARRRCTTTGCGASLADDGTATPCTSRSPVLDHAHTASYPLDAPRPGTWSFHS